MFSFQLIATPGSKMSQDASRAGHVNRSCTWVKELEKDFTSSHICPLVSGKGHGSLLAKWLCSIVFKSHSSIVDHNINTTVFFLHEVSQLFNGFFISKIKKVELWVQSFLTQVFNSCLKSTRIKQQSIYCEYPYQSPSLIPGCEEDISLVLLTKSPCYPR